MCAGSRDGETEGEWGDRQKGNVTEGKCVGGTAQQGKVNQVLFSVTDNTFLIRH